jgi:hypothetical protein
MLSPTRRQSNLFFLPLARQASLLKDDLLDPVDELLDDPALVELVRQCLATRSPRSTTTGRPGIAPDRLLRCCVLKHVKGWSFRELEREVCSNLVYRRFTGFDEDVTPTYSVFSRNFALLAPVTPQIHNRVVDAARERKVVQGQKMRTDTTAVETNIHYRMSSLMLMYSAGVNPVGAKVRSPVAWIVRRKETESRKSIDKAILGMVSESSGRNESERTGGPENVNPGGRALGNGAKAAWTVAI